MTASTFTEERNLRAAAAIRFRAYDAETARQLLLASVILQHLEHPQYEGYFDDWTARRAATKIETKGGVHALRYDWVLVSPNTEIIPGSSTPLRPIWGLRTGHVVLVESHTLASA